MPTRFAGSRSAAGEREHHRTNLWAQLARFIGLFLSPILGLLVTWLIHLWVAGIHVSWGPIDWDVQPSPAAMPLAVAVATALTIRVCFLAWHFAEHRKDALRKALVESVAVVGALFSINIGTGPHVWWSPLLILGGWFVAVVWSIARLDVTRNDQHADEGSEKEGFWDRLGVSRKTKLRAETIYDEKTGEAMRVDIDVHHDRERGETAEVFHEGGLAKMESAAGGPKGMASVAADPDHANRSRVSVPFSDPFKRPAYVGPLSAPRRSIGEWVTVADSATGKVARFSIGNGVHTPTPTSFALIGMTRSGKTGTETQVLTEMGSRSDWVCLYLNQAKGLQDAGPLLPILEAVMIADDETVAKSDARAAVKNVRNIMAYRQRQLALFNVSAWSPRCAERDESKRPSRVVDGARVHMEAMPFLTVFIGEADSLLSDGRIGDDAVFIGSKGLSLGVNVGTSLQKPDFRSMPTNIRSQIGLWLIHGLAQSDDEEFVIETPLRKSGVNPGSWGQRKPGQHYMIGTNTEDEALFSVALKTRFIVGETHDSSGRKYSFDELNDRYMAEMLRRNIESAKYQARLDRGSADATGGWWDEQAAKAVNLRTATPPQTAPASSAPAEYVPPGLRGTPRPQVDPQDDDDAPTAEEMTEMHEEAAEVTEVEGIELYPGGEGKDVDLTREPDELPDPAPEDDPLHDPEDEARPAPRDRAAALEALARAFDEQLSDPKLRDPKDPDCVITDPVMIYQAYKFRERPWFYSEFALLAEGEGPLSQRYILTLAEDLGIRRGKYRLRRVTGNAE